MLVRVVEKERYLSYVREPTTLSIARAPSTLSEFQAWWDIANSLRVDYFSFDFALDDNWLEREGKKDPILLRSSTWIPDKQVKIIPKEDVTSVVFAPGPVPEISPDSPYLSPQPTLIVDMRMPDGLPARLFVRGFLSASLDQIKPSNLNPDLWQRRSGSFVEAFPELQQLQVGLSVQRLDTLKKKLEEQATEPQTFELVGLKFQVARWGILVILMIQGYFWILIHELKKTVNPTDAASLEVAWIGLFVSRVGRLAFLCSLLVPTVAVFVLAHPMLPAFQLAVTALSLLLSILSFLRVPVLKVSAS